MGTEARMKSLLSVSLILLSFSLSSTSKLLSERNDGCAESSPFLIKNGSPNAKKPYLTLDVAKNTLSGGKLSKKGKPRKNQIWTWLNCADGDFLSNRAEGSFRRKANHGRIRFGPGSTVPMETSSATVLREAFEERQTTEESDLDLAQLCRWRLPQQPC